MEEKKNKAWDDLLFGVRRSVRYHIRRRRFFEGFNTLTMGVAIVLSSGAVASVLGGLPEVAAWTASIVALFTGFDLVMGSVRKARLYDDFARNFIRLEAEMVLVASPSGEDVRVFTVKRLEFEADEPPVLRVLDTLCHNELARSMGVDDEYKVGAVQSLLAHLVDFREGSIKKRPKSEKTNLGIEVG